MVPVLCIGETKEEYELGLNEEICTLQLSKDLKGLTGEQVSKIVIAYEPIWAIGTGLTATPDIAQSVHAAIRKWLRRQYGKFILNIIFLPEHLFTPLFTPLLPPPCFRK